MFKSKTPKMPKPQAHHEELPSIDPATLGGVTGGFGDMSTMMMMMMMKRRNDAAAAAAAAPPPQPPQPALPKIMLNGVEQPASALTGNGSSFQTTV